MEQLRLAVQANLHSVDAIERLSNEWLSRSFTGSQYETKREWEKRRALVVPILIDEKLKWYEKEGP